MSENTTATFFGGKLTTRQLIGFVVIPLILAGVFGLVWAGGPGSFFAGESADSGNASADSRMVARVMPVLVSPVKHVSSIDQPRVYTGIIKSKQQSEIGFELAGRIIEIRADEGDEVDEGEVIAVMDSQTLVARRDAIQADLDRANQVLNELNAGPREETIAAARADVRSAEAQQNLAEVNLKRSERLIKSNAISRSEYDQSVFENRSSVSALESARQRLTELEMGTRIEKVSAQQAAVRSLEAALSEVNVSITKCEITAPFDALVTKRMVDTGSIANPGTTVFKLVDHKNLEARVGLPVDIAAKAIPANDYSLNVAGGEVNARCIARIGEIDPGTRTQTVLFRILPDEQTGELPLVVSGQLCEISLSGKVKANGFNVPNAALTSGVRGLWAVFIARETKDGWEAMRCDVEVLKTGVDFTLCSGALVDGDLLIVDGIHKVTNGQPVSVKQQGE